MSEMPKKRDQEVREAFLTALGLCAQVKAAAEAAGAARSTLYRWRDEEPAFASAWKQALERGIDALEDEAFRRALEGVEDPVYYQGKVCGTVRRYSDALLIFLLKSRRPERYRERSATELSGPGGSPLSLSDTERAARIAALLARAEAVSDALGGV